LISYRACGWCDASNPTDVQTCHVCGHDAQVARMFCQCRQCTLDAPGEQTIRVRVEPLVWVACPHCGAEFDMPERDVADLGSYACPRCDRMLGD
jgi:hypothetical protein